MPDTPPRNLESRLGQDVARALRRRGLFQAAAAGWVVVLANKMAKNRFRALRFKEGELLCQAGTVPAGELQILSDRLRAALNKELGRDLVRSIRFKQGQN